MSNQTLPKSPKNSKEASTAKTQSARQAKGRVYRRQTARVEERRDGKPLVFGWGKHLSRRQKTRIQTRAFWTFAIVAIVAVVGVLGYSFYYVNYAVPAQPIVSVNGQQIPQSLYRKLNFYLSQDMANQLAAIQTELSAAQQEENSSDPTTKAEGTQAISNLTTQQQTLQNEYSVPTVGSLSAEDLVDDVLIQAQIPQLEAKGVPAAYLEATSKEIDAKLAAFKKEFPPTVTYSQFLNSAKMSEDDFRQLLAILVRRDNMQNYLASQIGAAGLQVHGWILQGNSQTEANKFLSQLKGLSGANLLTEFQKLAKRSSRDANTKAQGGDMGWLVAGDTNLTGTATAERWLFDPARKVGDLSPALTPVSGEYDIYYISAIDPHRPINSSNLSTLKSDALSNWIAVLKASPQTHVGALDSTKQLDSSNFPSNLPAGAPASTPSTGKINGPFAG
ncbi:MAG TPA: peptidylprolyl isomerase [Ktedonobacterales bacterium]|nr:peptidylprolyl isomerase [Ktedonobacterales bacterium]